MHFSSWKFVNEFSPLFSVNLWARRKFDLIMTSVDNLVCLEVMQFSLALFTYPFNCANSLITLTLVIQFKYNENVSLFTFEVSCLIFFILSYFLLDPSIISMLTFTKNGYLPFHDFNSHKIKRGILLCSPIVKRCRHYIVSLSNSS